MISRIVKLRFNPGKGDFFFDAFNDVKEKIRGFEGNFYLEAMRDIHNPDIVFTYSKWESEEALNKYRKSDVFGAVWPLLKSEFAGKPEAWSVDSLFQLK